MMALLRVGSSGDDHTRSDAVWLGAGGRVNNNGLGYGPIRGMLACREDGVIELDAVQPTSLDKL